MKIYKILSIIGTSLMCVFITNAQESFQNAYDDLTPDNLPSLKQVIKASLNALPNDIKKLHNWSWRTRVSALLPQVQFQYRTFEQTIKTFDRLTQTTTTTDNETVTKVSNKTKTTTESPTTTTTRYQSDGVGGTLDYINTKNENNANTVTTAVNDRNTIGENIIQQQDNVNFPRNDTSEWRNDYTITGTWQLPNLIFHQDETRAMDLNRQVANFRLNYIQDIGEIYEKLKSSVESISKGNNNERLIVQRELNAGILDQLTKKFISQSILAGDFDY